MRGHKHTTSTIAALQRSSGHVTAGQSWRQYHRCYHSNGKSEGCTTTGTASNARRLSEGINRSSGAKYTEFQPYPSFILRDLHCQDFHSTIYGTFVPQSIQCPPTT